MGHRASVWLAVLSTLAACGAPRASAPAVVEPASSRTVGVEPSAAPSEPAPSAGTLPAACTAWNDTVEVARLTDLRLGEVSGLVASRAHPGVLYVHNDSGEPYTRFFAITTEGEVLAEVVLDGAPSNDLEDIAYADGWLYLADTGDNGARDGSVPVRREFALIRVREPELPAERGATLHTSAYERFVLRYPDHPRDCEAVLIDPLTGDIFFLSKENEGPVAVFVAHAPLSSSAPTVLESALTMPGGGSLANAITAADISSDGASIAVRTYLRAFLYPRSSGEGVAEALARSPVELPVIREWQGEALGFSVDGRTLYSIPEGDGAPVHSLTARCTESN